MIDRTDTAPVIRTMKPEEVALSIQWAAREGWNPGLNDAHCFYAADSDGFLVAEVAGEAVGCISAVKYGSDFGFLGLYIVLPEHRGKGYGIALWNEAMGRLDQRNLGLDGVVAQQGNYKKSGFNLVHRNVRYELKSENRASAISTLESELKPKTKIKIGPLSEVAFGAVSSYDMEYFHAERREFLECWINQPGAISLGAIEDGHLIGYGVIRPCLTGSKIGPLFAETDESAKAILVELLKETPPEGPIYLDVPEPNKSGIQLAKKCGMNPVFETARMYTRKDPQLPLSQIYGITSFELG